VNVPIEQLEHTEAPERENLPGLQVRQADSPKLEAKLPGGHSGQDTEPEREENLPREHFKQVACAATSMYSPARHWEQVVGPEDPDLELNDPGRQTKHPKSPVALPK